jgi:hypothetical protein
MGPVAAIFTVLAAFAVLGLTSWRWGADSRVGRDWQWGRADSSSPDADGDVSATGQDAGARRRLVDSARKFFSDQAELHERLDLLNRPWEETFLHWSGDPDNPHLHGRVPPPRDGRRRSVTRRGWCPGLVREHRQAPR